MGVGIADWAEDMSGIAYRVENGSGIADWAEDGSGIIDRVEYLIEITDSFNYIQ